METIEYKGYTIEIEQDDMAENPLTWNNTIAYDCHRHYSFSPQGASIDDLHKEAQAGLDDYEISYEDAIRWMEKRTGLTAYAVTAIDHGGLWLTGSYPVLSRYQQNIDRWDRGVLCIVFVLPEQEKGIYEDFKKYCEGDVWMYTIADAKGNNVDALGGIYGYEDAVSEAKARIEIDVDHKSRLKLEKVKRNIKNRVPLIYRDYSY